MAFADSPALYEHLSVEHTVDQKAKWRQPRGRQGKTIVPQKRAVTGPVVVTAVQPYKMGILGDASTSSGRAAAGDAPGSMFEDLDDGSSIKAEPPSKRARRSDDGGGDEVAPGRHPGPRVARSQPDN